MQILTVFKILNRLLPHSIGWLAFGYDLLASGAALLLSLYLRLGGGMQDMPTSLLAGYTLSFMAVAGGVFLSTRLYRRIWEYLSLQDLIVLMRAVTITVILFTGFVFVATRLEGIPRSVPIIVWFILPFFLGGARALYRILLEKNLISRLLDGGSPIDILLAGAGSEADIFLRALRRGHEPYRVLGIVSGSATRVNRVIGGVPVVGTFQDIQTVVQGLKAKGFAPSRLVITQNHLDGESARILFENAEKNGLTLARIPRLTDLENGEIDSTTIRPIDVEDLLGRGQRPLDCEGVRKFISGRRVLITGAGGSIGSELVRQISDLGPERVGILDNSEFNLYSIDLEIRERNLDIPIDVYQADVRNKSRVFSVIREFSPDLVFHAAALKHVPMVEVNPGEGVLSNVLGTMNIADACRDLSVATMVLISTDKAVNPTNIMGATKRIAEQYCQALDIQGDVSTHFITVRFGNVLGSTGSVVPLFQRQLAKGGPLTVTHPDITRYFMTIREAVGLVMQASHIGSQNASQEGKVFVLDMGAPIKIDNIARQMVRLQGLNPDHDIKIKYTGLRPGEKLYEEIFHDDESMVQTTQPGLLLSSCRPGALEVLQASAVELLQLCEMNDIEAICAKIKYLVPEYMPDTGSVSRGSLESPFK